MNKMLTVARWEFLEKVRSKAFIISLIIMPLIMVIFGVLPGLLMSKEEDRTLTLGIIDESGKLFSEVEQRITEKYKLDSKYDFPMYKVIDLTAMVGTEDKHEKANALMKSKSLEGYFTIPASVFDSGKVEYRAKNVGNFRVQERFSRTIEEIIVEQRLTARGLNAKLVRQLMMNVNVRSIKVSEKGGEQESNFLETFFSSYVVLMMLMFLVMTSGQLLIRSVVEEKQNRVIEVLLSSCTSRDLMAGKILGLSGLGLVQMGVWGLGILAFISRSQGFHIDLDVLLLSVVYFALGYLMYAGIFVAAGAPVTTEQEAQQITTYVSLTLVFQIVLAMPAMQNPDSMLIRVLSFFPLMTPAFMVLRMPIQMPASWEIAATIALLVVCAAGMMWVAGKIFRIAILVYGKRPSVGELWKWVREA